jgi:hypothetical protein
MLWETGNTMLHPQAKTCTYDMTDCYFTKTIPVIQSVSANSGYTTGGQNFTIEGFGFDNATLDIQVAGQSCVPTFIGKEKIQCLTQASSATAQGVFAGQFGAKRTFIDGVKTFTQILTAPGKESLLLHFDSPTNIGYKDSQKFEAWFVAPETTSYRFYVACDDTCQLLLDTTPDSIAAAAVIVESLTEYIPYRQSHKGPQSAWIPLVAGQKYLLQGVQIEHSGNDHFQVGVEIQETANTAANHHHSMKETQVLSVRTTQTKEQTRVRISYPPSGGIYKIAVTNPRLAPGEFNYTKAVTDAATAVEFKDAVKGYYMNEFDSDITVDIEMHDATGLVTVVQADYAETVYVITLHKLISGQSADAMQAVKDTSTSVIQFEMPDAVQLSAKPISGNMFIRCLLQDQTFSDTREFKYTENEVWIAEIINQDCYQMNDKVNVKILKPLVYLANAMDLEIHFYGLNSDPAQYSIERAVVGAPLSSDPALSGGPARTGTTTVPKSNNVFFHSIPFELLRTVETDQQVSMTVDGVPAACHNLNCQYNYVAAPGQVDFFSFDQASGVLNVTGTSFPVEAEIDTIIFADSHCTISSASATSISCTLVREPTCGKWVPTVRTIHGKFPSVAATQDVTCAITSVTNLNKLNVLGGDLIRFRGSNFPHQLEGNTITIQFNDNQITKAKVIRTSTDSFIARTERFDKVAALNKQFSISVDINGVIPAGRRRRLFTMDFTTKSENEFSLSMTPLSVSPVLKRNIDIRLDANFPHALNPDDFEIKFISQSEPSYVRNSKVVAVDDSTKTLTVKFGGAISGQYDVEIVHNIWGRVDTDALTLDVSSQTSSISPLTGSIYGGTLVTLAGTNWGNARTDNPVEIFFNGLPSVKCYVQETSETEIKCRVDTARVQENALKGKMLVFLKTYEEANCTASPDCMYTFTSTVPETTAIASVWDTINYVWTLDATTRDPVTGSAELFIGGKKQTTRSVAGTAASFEITDAPSQNIAGSVLYWDIGLGLGNNIVGGAVALEPRVVSVSPNVGSEGGSLITLNVQGVGKATQGLDVVDAAGNSVCQSLKIANYGQVLCLTKAQAINSQLSVTLGGTQYNCANSDTNQCAYATNSDSTVSSVQIVGDNKIVFQGSNLNSFANDVLTVQFAGINATTVTADANGNQVVAEFQYGVPFVQASQVPVLSFNRTSSGTVMYPVNIQSLQHAK